jgi:ribonuclease III
MGPRESNERLEFLGDSVLGLVTSEYLYRHHPDEHEGQLTKTKSLLVSKAILSRRALQIGIGRFILMSHSEIESGGRKRASILADAFESVLGAIYLDQGFEAAQRFVVDYLLRGSGEIVADKRHRNYKSQLQEYVQSTFHTHPVYRIRSQVGPDHSKLFLVEVMVGRRVLGEGRGSNKKEAEQGAARDAMEQVAEPGERRAEERGRREPREPRGPREEPREPREETRPYRVEEAPLRAEVAPLRAEVAPLRAEVAPSRVEEAPVESEREGRRGRRGGRGRRSRPDAAPTGPAPGTVAPAPPLIERVEEMEPRPGIHEEDDIEEVGRPEGPLDERHEDPFETGPLSAADVEPAWDDEPWGGETPFADEEEEDEEEEDVEPAAGPADEPGRGGSEEEGPLETAEGTVEREDRGGASRTPREPEPPASPQFGRKRQRRR